jgi:NAD dependent epimerase/dehydratase family enzyme
MAVLLRAIDSPQMAGLYHVTSPNPIRNEEMMASYRKAVGRRFDIPSPSFITTIGAWLLGSYPALALTGRRGHPTRLVDEGYSFRIASFSEALELAIPVQPRVVSYAG